MKEETFWTVIDELERLSSLDPHDVEGFCEQLAAKVATLARLPLAGLTAPDVTDAGRAAPPLVGDAHENLLYVIVASGRSPYERVASDPSVVEEEEWDAGEAELFIDTVSTCLWTIAGVDWSDEVDPLRAHLDFGWYETYRGSAWKNIPGAYLTAARELDQKLNQSQEWLTWWQQTSLRKIKVGITVNAERNRHKVERGKNIARADFEMDRSYLADRDPAALRKLVTEEAHRITQTIATELRMTPPPALP